MISAFGVEHGAFSKADMGEYGWSSKEAHKRTMKEIRHDSKMSAGHGNKQRMAAHTAVGTGLGAGIGAGTGAIDYGPRGAAIGAGIGAATGALSGMASGKGENLQRAAHRKVGGSVKRGDIRRLKEGERATAFRGRIVKD